MFYGVVAPAACLAAAILIGIAIGKLLAAI
jgi:hypothetical protein